MPSRARSKPTPAEQLRAFATSPKRVGVLFALGFLIFAGVLWWTHVPSIDGPPARVLIPRGATFRQAADSLAAAKLIRYPRLFSLYGAIRGRDRTIHAGTYVLAYGQPWEVLIDALHSGKGAVVSVTIPEGWAIRQIVPYLAKELELSPDSLHAAIRDSALRARLGVPTPTLEGYLFPDTYTFAVGSTPRQIVAVMVGRFEQIWKPEWESRLVVLRRTRHEIVTLASIVEKEVRVGSERPIVAGVYWNRLKINQALQADPTVRYATNKFTGRVLYSDLDAKSPYNTYIHPGLPPGPIASPGEAALAATLNPAQVPFRFFVAMPDGHHEFRRTYAEHLVAVERSRAAFRNDSTTRATKPDSTADSPADSTKKAEPPADSASRSRGRGGA